MDAVSWTILGVAAGAGAALAALAPRLKRDHRRRQLTGGGTSLSGLGMGLDAVWRPSAEEAHTDWDARVELPAPAPSPGDPGRIRDGRIMLDGPSELEHDGV